MQTITSKISIRSSLQKYQNYRIIYIDDASTDGTLNLVADYAKENNQYHRFTFIKNKENRGSLANYYTGTYLCQDQEIVVHLDGDDWFKHEYVLQKLNNVYQGKNVWMTYGQNEEIHFDKENNKFYTAKGHCKKTGSGPVRFNAYREIAWRYTHLKTHYAGLFKHIKLKSLFDNDGRFFVSATDSAMMFSMLELSGGKFKFIDEILYVYNALNPINHKKIRKLRQIRCKSIARAKKKYNKLETEAIPTRDIPNNAKSDLIIISALGPDHTKRTLESVQCYAAGVENIYVLHQKSFKSCLEKTIKKTPNNHIILTKDNMILKDFVDVSSCIQLLEQTYAYGFYLSLGKNIKKKYTIWGNQTIPNYQKIEDNIFAWQFKLGEHDWRRPNNFLMTLYRKDDILQSLTEKNYNSVDSLEKIWNVGPFDMDDVGLFCENSKAVQVSELYKKSILALYLLQNNSITV